MQTLLVNNAMQFSAIITTYYYYVCLFLNQKLSRQCWVLFMHCNVF